MTGTTVLLCLAHSGATASGYYRHWGRALAPDVEVVPVDLPGRGTCRHEPTETGVESVVAALGRRVLPHTSERWAVFGHSLGGLLAYELVRHLTHERGCRPPVRLFVSGRRPPHLPGATVLGGLDDDALLDAVTALGGMPATWTAHRGVRRMILPALRYDVELGETYRHTRTEPLACPVSALGGRHDVAASSEDLHAWRHLTRAGASAHTFDGGHFYLDGSAAVLDLVRAGCTSGEHGAAR